MLAVRRSPARSGRAAAAAFSTLCFTAVLAAAEPPAAPDGAAAGAEEEAAQADVRLLVSVLDVRMRPGEPHPVPLDRTPDGTEVRVFAETADDRRVEAERVRLAKGRPGEAVHFELEVPPGRTRLSVEPVMVMVGAMGAVALDATGASFDVAPRPRLPLRLYVLPPSSLTDPPVAEERAAARAIENLRLTYDLDEEGHVVAVRPGPSWLLPVGLETAPAVGPPSGPAGGADVVRLLAAFPKLRSAELGRGQLTDVGLAAIERLPELRTLTLPDESVRWEYEKTERGRLNGFGMSHHLPPEERALTPAGVERLGEVAPGLERIVVPGWGDEHLSALGAMEHLREVVAASRTISWRTDPSRPSDAGLRALLADRQLRVLDLTHTNVTDAGVAALAGQRDLEELSLDGTLVTDAAAATLVDLPNLKRLDLGGTHVTDAILPALKRMPALERLEIEDTVVTLAGLRELHRDRPGLAIYQRSSQIVAEP